MGDGNSGRRGYGTFIRFLGYLSPTWCALTITLIAASQIATSAEVGWKPYDTLFSRVVAVLLFGVMIIPIGVALGRFLVRAAPPPFSVQPQRGLLRMVGPITLAGVLIGFLAFMVFVFSFVTDPFEGPRTPILLRAEMDAILTIFCGSIAVSPLIHRHRKPRAFLDRPFVLFLRRFSTFSDRAVIALILKQTARGVPVVFLTPIFSRPGDWDPFLVGFAGLKLMNPWRSMPIVLRAPDDHWQGVAEELICRAHTILLDISQTSGAMRTEAEMIDSAKRWANTACLRLSDHNAGHRRDPLGDSATVREIQYTKSWIRALPRMTIGLLFILVPTAIVGNFLNVYSGLAFMLFTCGSVAAYYSMFVHPMINKEARMALKTLLRPAKAALRLRRWRPTRSDSFQ
jgi:hypothetical protein